MKAVLTVLLVAAYAMGSTGQTITRSVIVPDYAEPPADLSTILSYADAVIVGQVVSHQQDTERVADRPHPIIRHKVKVLDVVKGTATMTPGATIEIVQPGGTGRLGSVEVAINNSEFPVFSVDSKYIFILRASGRVFSSYAGPATVFPIVGNDRLVVSRASEHIDDVRSHRDDSVSSFVSFLREKVQRGRSRGELLLSLSLA